MSCSTHLAVNGETGLERSASDKRGRLVAAAVEHFHREGYARTSLAEVARAAGLSPGHVFYHFRTKEDLARAVVEAWCLRLAERLAALEEGADGWERLARLVDRMSENRGTYVGVGCPLAGLARDLRREGDALGAEAPRLYAVQDAWVRAQFAGLGFAPEAAADHARFLMATYHGTILLAYAQNDESLIAGSVATLHDWLRRLRAESSPNTCAARRAPAADRSRGGRADAPRGRSTPFSDGPVQREAEV
jgi:TetR/AcrR family transcriptional regulator, transcriptional repressor for nem operon